MRKEKVAPLVEDKIPSFVALGRQVAANGPQLTPEQEAPRRRMLAAAQVLLEISGGIGCVSLPSSVLAAPLRAFASAWTWIGPTNLPATC
jgi:hypothetical protein